MRPDETQIAVPASTLLEILFAAMVDCRRLPHNRHLQSAYNSLSEIPEFNRYIEERGIKAEVLDALEKGERYPPL